MELIAEDMTIGGRRVHISRKAGADMVVLIRLAGHGGGVWNGVWNRLADRFTVVNIDLGAPSAIGDEPEKVLRGFADIVAETGRALHSGPFHILGWTGGGQIALQMAVHHSDLLKSMVLVTPLCAAGEMRQVEAGVAIVETLLRSGNWETYTLHWLLAGMSDAFIQTNFDRIEQMVADRMRGDHFVKLDIAMVVNWMRALRRNWHAPETLSAIRTPTLVVSGGQNRWHAGPSPEMAEALHKAIPGSQIERFEALGALMLLEQPQPVLERINRFLAGPIIDVPFEAAAGL